MRWRTVNNRKKIKWLEHNKPFSIGIRRAIDKMRWYRLRGIRLDGQKVVLHYPSGKFHVEEI